MKTYKGLITSLPDNGIFVFGSNTQGRHGAGTALIAKEKFGAIYGQAAGLHGRSYGIVTKDLTKSVHPSVDWRRIVDQIETLYTGAKYLYPEKDFYVAYSGTGTNLNGYAPSTMALMFAVAGIHEGIPDNIIFEEKFAKLI